MARNVGNFVENQFVKGLITEATGFNFPENAVTETWNCRFRKNGEVARRGGLVLENGVSVVTQTVNSGVNKTYLWQDVGSGGGISFLVYQNGHILYFYGKGVEGDFASNKKSFTVNLRSYRSLSYSSNIATKEASFAHGDGKLFVSHPYCDPIYIKYNKTTDSISVTRITVKVRDIYGLEDGFKTTERPKSLTINHAYNLYNQGWGNKVLIKDKNNGFPAKSIHGKYEFWPSNADIWWLLKNAEDKFDRDLLYSRSLGNTEAPKGYFVLNAFNQDRSAAVNSQSDSSIGHITPVTSNGQRPSSVAFFAGRVWYGGVSDDDFFNTVYFSQILVNDSAIGKCYQNNDPTNENLSDLLDTDGGTILIVGVGKITSLFSTGNSLLIFATNGIWSVSGSGQNGAGFVATDFTVTKVSSIGASQATSILDVDGMPIWWNQDGLWAIQRDQLGSFSVVSMSNDTIKTFIEENIPVENRNYIQGAYNPMEHTIQWIFRSSASSGLSSYYTYDKILEFNLQTGAFYPFTFSGKTLKSISCSTGSVTGGGSASVTSSSGASVTVGGIQVTHSDDYEAPFVSAKYKYISAQPDTGTGIVFIEEGDYTAFKDFTTNDFVSYFITGAKIHGEGNKYFTSEYLTFICKDETGNGTTDQGATVEGRWDWANSSSSNKWSAAQQIYSDRNFRNVQRRRLIIRGTGPALQIKITSQTGKGFTILGWSAFESADASP